MSTVLVFGAGASFGNPDCSPEPPPLAARLFDELQAQGPTAASIEPAMAALFRKDFEEGMLAFYQARPGEVSGLLREMAQYFAKFTPGPDNYYIQVLRWAATGRSQAVIVTTNYDLLIELAIDSVGKLVTYGPRPVAFNYISVLKIHGSANFLPAMAPRQITGLSIVVPEGASAVDSPVRLATSAAEVMRFCMHEDVLAPAIACYMRGKPILYCPTFVREQQTGFRKEIQQAKRIIVIGLRVNPADAHIWEPLAQAKARIDYVGLKPDAAAFEDWSRGQRGQRAVMANSFGEALPMLRVAFQR